MVKQTYSLEKKINTPELEGSNNHLQPCDSRELNRSTLYHDDYGGRSVDGELKSHERIQESSPHNELLDDLDQEKRKGYTSKARAHDVKRLLDVVVLEGLNTPSWVKGRQVSSKPPGNRNANESHINHPTDLAKRLAFS